MSTTSNPKTTISLLAAQLAVSTAERHDLIAGTIPASGTAVAETLYQDLGAMTKAELDALFVANSDIRNRIQQFIDANGGYSKLSAQVEDEDGTAVNAAGAITPTGTATEDGTLTINLIDEEQFSVAVALVIDDTVADVVGKIVAAFATANFPSMPVVVSDGTTKADIDAVDGGTIGNNYKIEVLGAVAGITIAITAMTAGANDAVATTYFDNLANTRFTGINWPTAWFAQVEIVKDFLDDRFDSDNAILDGVAFVGMLDTFANNKAAALLKNSQSLVYMGNTTEMFQPADWTASYFQGVRARRLTTDAPISDFIVTTAGQLDVFGGPALASLPYFNTPLAQLSLADLNLLYDNSEQSELEESGFSTYGVNNANNGMITGALVTTYTTDGAGNPNLSFHFLNYVDTSSVCREYFFNNLKARFVQSRLTSGTLVIGRSMENEESIRTEYKKLFKDLGNLALVSLGSDADKFFDTNLTVVNNLVTRKSTGTMKLPIVTQLGVIIVSIQLSFTLEG